MSHPSGPAGTDLPRLTLDADRILRGLWTTLVVLVAIYLALQVFRLRTGYDTLYGAMQFFDLDEEQSLPTFFSICLLLANAGLLALISRSAKHRGDPLARHWTCLGIGFFLLALDEAAGIHENFGRPLELLADFIPLPGAAWVIAGLFVVTAVFVAYLPFLRRLPARTRRVFLLAGMLYVGGAIGFEILNWERREGYNHDLTGVLYVTAEEALEMSGAIVFMHGLFAYFAVHCSVVGLAVKSRPPPAGV